MSRIKKLDTVTVIAGDDKGKIGVVLDVFKDQQRIIVDGVNLNRRHTKPDREGKGGGIIVKAASIHISNVVLSQSSDKAVEKEPARKRASK